MWVNRYEWQNLHARLHRLEDDLRKVEMSAQEYGYPPGTDKSGRITFEGSFPYCYQTTVQAAPQKMWTAMDAIRALCAHLGVEVTRPGPHVHQIAGGGSVCCVCTKWVVRKLPAKKK